MKEKKNLLQSRFHPSAFILALLHPLVRDLRFNFDRDFLDVLFARRAHCVFNLLRYSFRLIGICFDDDLVMDDIDDAG